MRIAGRQVKLGDRLYHQGYRKWGEVTRLDSSGSVDVTFRQGARARIVVAQDGGMVLDKRQLYWVEPVQLDLQDGDMAKAERIVNFVIRELQ